MSKYEAQSVEDVDKEFDEILERAKAYAKKKVEEKREEIAYYKRTDFKEIEAELIEKYKAKPDEELLNRDYYKRMPEKQKKGMSYEEYADYRRKAQLKSALTSKKELDMLFDLLTDEQIEKLLNLLYEQTLQQKLLEAKEEKIFGKDNDKFYTFQENEYTPQVDKIRDEVYGRISHIDGQDARKGRKRERIANALKEAAGYGAFTAVGSLAGGVVGIHSGTFGLAACTALSGAAAATLCGVVKVASILHNEKAREMAEDLGIYEQVRKQCEALKAYRDYEDQLTKEHNIVPDQAEEYVGGLGL